MHGHLKTAYDIGAATAQQCFEKEARLAGLLLPGAVLGGATGAIAGDEGTRLQSALYGAGLGSILGAGGMLGGARLGIGRRGRQMYRRLRTLRQERGLAPGKLPKEETPRILQELGAADPRAAYKRIVRGGIGGAGAGLAAGGVGGGLIASSALGNEERR